jgi:hypothetical protein
MHFSFLRHAAPLLLASPLPLYRTPRCGVHVAHARAARAGAARRRTLSGVV